MLRLFRRPDANSVWIGPIGFGAMGSGVYFPRLVNVKIVIPLPTAAITKQQRASPQDGGVVVLNAAATASVAYDLWGPAGPRALAAYQHLIYREAVPQT